MHISRFAAPSVAACHHKRFRTGRIPLGTLPQRLAELPQDAEIVVYCRTGGRSDNAVQFLRHKGYGKALNLAGGINMWAEVVDPSMPKY